MDDKNQFSHLVSDIGSMAATMEFGYLNALNRLSEIHHILDPDTFLVLIW